MAPAQDWRIQIADAAEAEFDAIMGADPRLMARFLHVGALIRDFGPARVGMPHIRHLDGPIWEIRLKGRDNIARLLYVTATGRRVVVVRCFVKKTQATPRREIDLALRRAKELDG